MGEEWVAFRDLSPRHGGNFDQKNASLRPKSAALRPTILNETYIWPGPTLFHLSGPTLFQAPAW